MYADISGSKEKKGKFLKKKISIGVHFKKLR